MTAAALGDASGTMMAAARPLRLRNLQTLAELGVEKKHHGDVSGTDDECDRPDQQLPHPGNRRRARDHTPAGNSQTIGTTSAQSQPTGSRRTARLWDTGHAGV
jgi:hypothetical protein